MEFIDRDPINHLFWALAERLFKLLLSATIWDVLCQLLYNRWQNCDDIVDDEDGNVDDYGYGAGWKWPLRSNWVPPLINL